MVEELKVEPSLAVKFLCKILEVNRSSYYAWAKRPTPKRDEQSRELSVKIRQIFEMSRGTYGAPRIQQTLSQDGHRHGKNRIGKIMAREGLSAAKKRKFVKTTDSKHDLPVAPRVIQTENQETMPTEPNQAWATDITYIETSEGWLFLAVYLDLFTRMVVGAAMADHMRSGLVIEALDAGLGRQRGVREGLTVHSDRGVQYACSDYRRHLTDKCLTASMSRKGNCYDNAYVESFFHTLKTELIYRRPRFASREEAKKVIFEYIEVWYNRRRLHSSLGYKSPAAFEALTAAS